MSKLANKLSSCGKEELGASPTYLPPGMTEKVGILSKPGYRLRVCLRRTTSLTIFNISPNIQDSSLELAIIVLCRKGCPRNKGK